MVSGRAVDLDQLHSSQALLKQPLVSLTVVAQKSLLHDLLLHALHELLDNVHLGFNSVPTRLQHPEQPIFVVKSFRRLARTLIQTSAPKQVPLLTAAEFNLEHVLASQPFLHLALFVV